jgi:TonB family protein
MTSPGAAPFFVIAGFTAALSAQQSSAPKPVADGFGRGAYRVGDGIRSPMPLGSPRLTGSVPPTTIDREIEVEAVVGDDGKVSETRVVRTFAAQPGAIDEAAAASIKPEPFSPGMLDGKPVPVIVTTIFWISANLPEKTNAPARPPIVTQFSWNPRGGGAPGSVAARLRHAGGDPKYTSDAMRAKIQGSVEIDVIVQPDGSPGEMRIARSLDGGQSLDGPALDVIKHWTFEPAKQNDRPVPARVTIALLFRLH